MLDRYPKYFCKKYKTYEEFKDDFLGEREEFGTLQFIESNHKVYW